MAMRTAATASAVVRPAISIIRRTRANNAACSGVGSGAAISVMQGSSLEQGSSSNSGQRLVVTVAGDEGSIRLDRVLAVRLAELSRSRLKALILAGSVTVGSAPIRDPAYHVTAGDTITIDVPQAVAAEPAGEDIALDIVYEDDDIIVIDKPRGLSPGATESRARRCWPASSRPGAPIRSGCTSLIPAIRYWATASMARISKPRAAISDPKA